MSNNNHHVSAEPSTGTAEGSNPAPALRAPLTASNPDVSKKSNLTCSARFFSSPSGCARQATETPVQTCVRALEGLARRTNLLDREFVKSCLANVELSKNRKTKVLGDISRFYVYLKIPFSSSGKMIRSFAL